jgi:hypothetical protein
MRFLEIHKTLNGYFGYKTARAYIKRPTADLSREGSIPSRRRFAEAANYHSSTLISGEPIWLLRKVHRSYKEGIAVIKKVLPSCVLYFARLGTTSETGQNNNKSSRVS